MSLVTACSRVLLNIYLFIYIYYTPNGGTGVGLGGGGVRLGEGRQENKHFMNKQLSFTLLMGVRGLGWGGGGVRLGEGRQENKHFMNKQLSLTHERKERWTDECDWMDETLCCGDQVTFFFNFYLWYEPQYMTICHNEYSHKITICSGDNRKAKGVPRSNTDGYQSSKF